MSSFRYPRSVLTLIGLALLASLEVGAPVQARTPYDGLWSVSLKVSQGSCVDREIECSSGMAKSATQATEVSSRRRAELASAVALRRVLERLACGQVPMGSSQTGKALGRGTFPSARALGSGWRAAARNRGSNLAGIARLPLRSVRINMAGRCFS